jgi:uncharacterized protein YqfA (UPF0365 family)
MLIDLSSAEIGVQGNHLMFRPVLVPLLAAFELGLEVVADNLEARCLGGLDVTKATWFRPG